MKLTNYEKCGVAVTVLLGGFGILTRDLTVVCMGIFLLMAVMRSTYVPYAFILVLISNVFHLLAMGIFTVIIYGLISSIFIREWRRQYVFDKRVALLGFSPIEQKTYEMYFIVLIVFNFLYGMLYSGSVGVVSIPFLLVVLMNSAKWIALLLFARCNFGAIYFYIPYIILSMMTILYSKFRFSGIIDPFFGTTPLIYLTGFLILGVLFYQNNK